MKITYYVAASEDGFIAREDGDVSWLEDLQIDEDDTGLSEFFSSIDGLVMGRGTYEFLLAFGSWPYGDKPAWVCTSRQLDPLPGASLSFTDDILAAVTEAREQGISHLWLLGGGRLASGLLELQLIDFIVVSEMPVMLGAGIPLFAHHSLQTLNCRDQRVIEKPGFRQIEIAVG